MTIDWSVLLLELTQAGLSRADIARHLNAPWNTVDNWFRGSHPIGSYAVGLFLLHQNRCKSPSLETQKISDAV